MFFVKNKIKEMKEDFNQRKSSIELISKDIEIPKGQYLIIDLDIDIGSIIGGRDIPPDFKIMESYYESIKYIKNELKTTSDDDQYYLLNSNKEIILYSFGETLKFINEEITS